MRRMRWILVGLALTAALHAADVAALLRDAAAAEARFDARTALQLYLQADAAKPNDALIVQKIARQYSDLSADLPTRDAQKHSCEQALAYALRAYALAPKDPENPRAILRGRKADLY